MKNETCPICNRTLPAYKPRYMVKGDAWTPKSMWDYILCTSAERELELRRKGFIQSNLTEE